MSETYVQVQPDSTGKKVQVFENTRGASTVEAQGAVSVDQYGSPNGIDGQPSIVQSRTLDCLLMQILNQLRITNFYLRELNPKILGDSPEVLSQDFTLTVNLVE